MVDKIAKFVDRTKQNIELEKLAEDEENNTGKRSFLGEVVDQESGLGGRTIVKVRRPENGGSSSSSASSSSSSSSKGILARFSVGDAITLRKQGVELRSEFTIRGVVCEVSEKFVSASMDDFLDEWNDDKVIMAQSTNEVTYKRLHEAMDRLLNYSQLPSVRMIDTFFGISEPDFDSEPSDLVFYDKGLNESQKSAVKFALSARQIALVQGPPGTGKTTTMVETIRQLVKRGNKVLVCAHTNIAVDNLVEKLSVIPAPASSSASSGKGSAAEKIRMVRLGHPARLMPSVTRHHIDVLVANADGTEIAADIKKDMKEVMKGIKKTRDRSERKKLRSEMKTLQKELRQREEKTVKEVVGYSNVVLCTNVGACDWTLRDIKFDVVVIDEAAQSLEASCHIALQKGTRAILAGDQQQLAPTIMSPEASRRGLGVTLFERLIEMYGEKVSRLLDTQYRMNSAIMQWSSDEFYGGRLKAHSSVAEHLLADLKHVNKSDETDCPLVLIDTAGCDYEEREAPGSESKMNEQEARVVCNYVRKLIDEEGLKESDIAIITPYSAQVELLREMLRGAGGHLGGPRDDDGDDDKKPKAAASSAAAVSPDDMLPFVEIGTVDGFQGREKEAIVFSMVRANSKKEIGFLEDKRRTNVAITRARRLVAVVGDSTTLNHSEFLRKMISYFEENGVVRSAAEFEE